MKRTIVCLAAILGFATIAAADTEVVDGIEWTYGISNGNASVGGGSASSTAVSTETTGDIMVPSTLGGCPVTRIRSYAFSGCSGLTSISIPDGVKTVGAFAFKGCSGLTSIAVPDSVEQFEDFIGYSSWYDGFPFHDCTGLPDPVFNASRTVLWFVPRTLQGAFTIPDGVTRVGSYALSDCSDITSLTIPNSVTNIGKDAFSYSSLTSVDVPGSVACIEGDSFQFCGGLTSVVIRAGVSSIGERAFADCSSLKTVAIPASVTNIEDWAFAYCSSLEGVYISDLDAWCRISFGGPGVCANPLAANPCHYAHHLYLNGAEVTSLVLPAGLTKIGLWAFDGCSSLTSITIPDGVASIGQGAFSGCSGLTSITIPEGVRSIGQDAFSSCSGLTSITILEGVTSIGQSAFSGCSGLVDIAIPRSVRRIYASAFAHCTNLRSIFFPIPQYSDQLTIEENAFPTGAEIVLTGDTTSIPEYAFSHCLGLTSVTIPSSVKTIGDNAFYGCSGLTSITIPDSVTSIGWSAFYGCSRILEPLYNSSGTVLWFVPRSSKGSLSIPSGVTSIGSSAFEGCSGLTSITIPDGVASIGQGAFSGCSGLTSITIPDSVTSIGEDAFSNCRGLTNAVFGNSVTSIGHGTFVNCRGLTSITIPDSVTSIGDYAFDNCRGLTSITIPNNVTNIGDAAFVGCTQLESITIPNSVTSIGYGAFEGCVGLSRVTATPEWGRLFSFATNLTFTIPTGVATIGYEAFRGCSGLVSILIPDGVTSIGSLAFYGCSGLAQVTIPDSLTDISYAAFACCSDHLFDTNTIPGVKLIDGWVVGYTDSLPGSVDLTGVRGIASGAFSGNSGLTSITIPNGVTRIGDGTFRGCSRLESVTIPDSVISIGCGAFRDCSSLTSMIIPSSITTIDSMTFYGCSNLQKLFLPRQLSGQLEWYSVPSDCAVVYYDELVRLFVSSALGNPVPDRGTNYFEKGDSILVSVSSPVPDAGTNVTRFVCTGWTGTGAVPPTGEGNEARIQISEDSSLTWRWETNVWIGCAVSGDATSEADGVWAPSGGTATIGFSLGTDLCWWTATGDADGVSVDASTGTISIPADRPRSVGVQIEAVTADNAADGDGSPLVWQPDATTPWYAVEDATASDGFCLRSGAVAENPGTNALETMVTGPGRLSFAWKMTNTRNDYARFYVDGAQQGQISRTTTAWNTNELDVAAGEHTLRWAFERGGSATNCAAFLDDVCWIPRCTLQVVSSDGTATPAVGTHDMDWGTEIEASVAVPAAAGGTRRVCTGWTGTGSVPATGTGTNLAFTVEEDSTLAWNWRTEHWIDVSVAGGGSTSFAPQWVADGTTVSVPLSPDWPLFDVALSGDADGVAVSGSTLLVPADGPRTIVATVTEKKVSLAISSEFGTAVPAAGTHVHSWGDAVTASVTAPAASGGTRRICTGWTGTGSVPASGTGTSVSFTMEADSTLAWSWRTEHWIDVSAAGDGSTGFTPRWSTAGETLEIALVPSTHLYTISLSGDVANGVELDGTTLRVSADRPRTIVATILERKLSLSVSSAFGTASPAVGTRFLSWGDVVPANVAIPPAADGTRHVFLGWTGTGSVPTSGTETSVAFTMEDDSTLAWRWRTEHWISIETAGPVETDFASGWIADGETLEVAYDVLFVDNCVVMLAGDTNGVVLDASARTVAIPCDGVRALRLLAEPVANGGALALAEALDAEGLVWTSAGDNAWTPQMTVTADGEDAAISGDASGVDSVLSTVLMGPGTLSWSWRLETAGGSGIDLEVDETDNPRRFIESDQAGSWVQDSLAIAGTGAHDVRFVFWNESGAAPDRVFLDRVSWTGAVAGGTETRTTPTPVPHDWFVSNGLVAAGAADTAFETSALAPARNGRPAWECYVAGLDPAKDEDFVARIDFVNGFPLISWTPSNVAGRAYAVYGKASLTNEWSSPINPTHRFFQVRVGLGSESGVDEGAWPGSVTVTFDAEGGTVDPATLTYDAPGALGALPVPVREGYEFLGWWTRETGGVRATAETAVPWCDWTLHAQWTPKSYTIAFDSAGGSAVASITAVYGSALTAPEAPTKDGYTFAGWTPAFPETMPLGGATLVALWSDSPRGLAVRYYDTDVSGAFPESESTMVAVFSAWTPTIETNSLAFGESLNPGISNVDNSDYSEFIDYGYTDLRFSPYEETTRFHSVYGSKESSHFSVYANGTIQVETGGTYHFGAVADDRMVLFIDGFRVLNVVWVSVAGGNPASGTGSIDLSPGLHTISIGFYEASGGEGFFVEWKRPGETEWSPLPQSVLSH